MLKSIEVWNFRSLRDVKIRRIQKLNLITGKNGGGKTTLLEAVFLLAGGANAALGFLWLHLEATIFSTPKLI